MNDTEFAVNLQARTIKHVPTGQIWKWDAVELTIDTEDKSHVNFDLTSIDCLVLDAVWEDLTKKAGKELRTLFVGQ
jgi:hypothetical protein